MGSVEERTERLDMLKEMATRVAGDPHREQR
jgi:hypothetical protein